MVLLRTEKIFFKLLSALFVLRTSTSACECCDA